MLCFSSPNPAQGAGCYPRINNDNPCMEKQQEIILRCLVLRLVLTCMCSFPRGQELCHPEKSWQPWLPPQFHQELPTSELLVTPRTGFGAVNCPCLCGKLQRCCLGSCSVQHHFPCTLLWSPGSSFQSSLSGSV